MTAGRQPSAESRQPAGEVDGGGPERTARGGIRRRAHLLDTGTGDHPRRWTRRRSNVGGAATNATGAQLERLVRNVRRAFESSAEDSPPAATLTEGMEHIAQLALAGMAAERPDAAPRGRSRLTAYIDPLSGRLPDGEVLPPAALEAVAGPLSTRHALRPLTVEDHTCHDLGRTQRLPRLALRELVGTLDGERCRSPGCTRRHKLQAHHVLFWEDNGPTELAKLLLLCSRHHTLVDAQAFQLHVSTDRRLLGGRSAPPHWRPRSTETASTSATPSPYSCGRRRESPWR